ncbi:protein lifeguard 1-like [Rhopilema esculentum]|uniref:protein lifeguard 1-like n=1 Tax=Rhopilema esculentum TaxID=499914 RepID=UPI0031D50DB2
MKNQEEVQPTNWQPYPPNNTYPANSYPAQPYAGQPYPAQPYPAQPYPAQPYGQPYPDQQGIPAAAPPSYENTITNTTSTTVIITDSHPESFHENDMFSFDSKSVRLGFIRKVYAILALQMVVTIGFSCLFMFHEPTKLYVQNHIGVYIAAYVTFFILYFVLACCTNVARSYPANMILLCVFTISLSYLVAAITSFHDTKIVLLAFGITLVASVSVMLFACQTKYDFTGCGGVLFVACISLLLFGIFAGIFVPSGSISIVNMVYAGLGALLFMGFLAYDTQLIMGGRKFEISPEDYVFAAMMLYIDIIYIFLFILSLIGGKN